MEEQSQQTPSTVISGSASFQSHLSTANSQQRLRAAPSASSKDTGPHALTQDHIPLPGSVAVTSSVSQTADNHPTGLWSSFILLLKISALLYCCLSVAIMSASILQENPVNKLPQPAFLVEGKSEARFMSRISVKRIHRAFAVSSGYPFHSTPILENLSVPRSLGGVSSFPRCWTGEGLDDNHSLYMDPTRRAWVSGAMGFSMARYPSVQPAHS
jgi:hypothetical protein